MCIRSVLLRRAEIARQQGVLEALRQAEQGIPTGQHAGATRVDAIMRWAFLQLTGRQIQLMAVCAVSGLRQLICTQILMKKSPLSLCQFTKHRRQSIAVSSKRNSH